MSEARTRAARALAAVLGRGVLLDEALAQANGPLAGRDRALMRELAYGVCRRYFELDGLLAPLLQRPLKARDEDLRALLLAGIYQLRYLRVPAHAAVAESVNAARALGKSWASGLVNAVLRAYQARAAELASRLDRAQVLAHPPWLLQAIEDAWPAHGESIVAANNSAAPMTLRVNRARTTRADWMARTSEMPARAGALCEDAIVLERAVDVGVLPGFAAGELSVQDEAAQLAAMLLGAQAGERVLDACAAPGGKSCHLLEQTQGELTLHALDNSPARLVRVEENLRRLGLQATLITGDATEPAAWWDGQAYDRILVDAPCTGTGVIRRHPDIKLLRQPAQVAEAAALQRAIVAAVWPLLKPGGVLLYCTCSIMPAENDAVIESFVTATGDAAIEPIVAPWGLESRCGRQLLPVQDGHDGFYYARLRKGS